MTPLLLLLLSIPLAQAATPPVIIIGAGISAAELANQLHKAQIPFLILEATDRVGGRLREAQLGPGGPLVEIGANWLQGYRPGVPIFDYIISRINPLRSVTDYDDSYFVQNGTIIADDIADPAWNAAERAMKKTYKVRKQMLSGRRKWHKLGAMDIRSAAEYQAGYKPRKAIDIAAWRFAIDFEYAVPADEMGVRDLCPMYAPDAPESQEVFWRDQRGFSVVVHHILKDAGVLDTTVSGEKLKLNAPVNKVQYGKRGVGVKVTTRDGSVYDGSVVVSTVPLGVLKDSILEYPEDKNRLTFEPPLPMEKRVSIAKYLMGDYLKIFVQFHSALFTAADPTFLLPLDCDEEVGFINIHNLNKKDYFPGSNAVLVTSTYQYSRELMCEDDEKVIADVLDYVSNALGRTISRAEVKAHVVPKFRRDEFFRGSWSVVTPSMSEHDVHHFNHPVGSLFFAGEAHHEGGLNGYVHGAWETGHEVASDVIAYLKMYQGGWIQRNVLGPLWMSRRYGRVGARDTSWASFLPVLVGLGLIWCLVLRKRYLRAKYQPIH